MISLTSTGSSLVGASYSRYSSDLQTAASITDQQRKCRERATRDGFSIAANLEFADEAVSGTKLRRDGLDRLKQAAKDGKFQVLYVENLSRLARESVITMPLLKELVDVLNIRIISVDEGIDSDQRGWAYVASIRSLQHEEFVNQLGDYVFRGQEGLIENNYSVGDLCFGFTSVPVPGTEKLRRGRNAHPHRRYVIDEERAPWVRKIFEWFTADKRSYRWIAQELTRLNVAKVHRSKKDYWTPETVRKILQNTKYVGIWPWARTKGKRNPLDGTVKREKRPEEVSEKWTRLFPELRIVSDELWEATKARLKELAEATHPAFRTAAGKLRGSKDGGSETHPRHLLSGLFVCGHCLSRLRTRGSVSYLGCPKAIHGMCEGRGYLRRDLAQRLVLEAIGKRILDNAIWRQAVEAELRRAWREMTEQVPAEQQALRQSLAEVDQKLARLIDAVELGEVPSDLHDRLRRRKAEKADLEKRLRKFAGLATGRLPEPTAQWVEAKLQELHRHFQDNTPAAALALRRLVGGRIAVNSVYLARPKAYHLQGRFVLKSLGLAQTVANGSTPALADAPAGSQEEEIVIDFREPPLYEAVAEEVKALWDQGLGFKNIAARLDRKIDVVKEGFYFWHQKRGLEIPLALANRRRPGQPVPDLRRKAV